MLNIAIITNKPTSQIKTLQTLQCPQPHRITLSRAKGFSNARNAAITIGGLNIQLNDDLILTPKLWEFAQTIKPGEFAFQLAHEATGDRPCSRVFMIYPEDFYIAQGFDKDLNYFFEDGDFYYRALSKGLKFRAVPDEAAIHIPHKHAFYKPKPKAEFEAAKIYVKYGQLMMPFKHIDRFFIPFRDYKVALQHFVLRTTFIIYWILKGVD